MLASGSRSLNGATSRDLRLDTTNYLQTSRTRTRTRTRTKGQSFVAHVAGDGFGAGADVHFFVDVFEMAADGFDADGELIGDFLVGVAFGEQDQNFLLAGAQMNGGFGGRAGFAEGLNDVARDFAGHGGAAAHDFEHRRAQIL